MKLACIPAYNEASHIESLVKSAKNHVDSVIVCDDGSTDNTAKIARNAGAVVISQSNQGYGAAISTLFDYARRNNAKIMVTLDG
ncbi:MAG: glycosyltransferase, partial [Candidatus Nitrosopelagicus sp.]|nr:glycosyltransferase [Candidatus Nitrosopelagicus sp.]